MRLWKPGIQPPRPNRVDNLSKTCSGKSSGAQYCEGSSQHRNWVAGYVFGWMNAAIGTSGSYASAHTPIYFSRADLLRSILTGDIGGIVTICRGMPVWFSRGIWVCLFGVEEVMK